MSSTCFASLQVCALRVTKLTGTGAPNVGANHGYVTDAAIKLDVDVEIEKGDEFTQKNGCGALVQTFKGKDTIKRLNLAMDLSQLDLELISFLDGSDLFSSGGNTIGMQYPSVTDTTFHYTCIEAWTKAWDGTAQAVPAFTTPNAAYFHWVFPRTYWVQGKRTMENGLMVVPMTGNGEENQKITINGPFDDWPVAIANQGGITRVGGVFLDATIPTAHCGSITVPGTAS